MILNKEKEYWVEKGGVHTASEINQQPETWAKTISQVRESQDKLYDFVDQVITKDDYQVIFTGAGTSEFVGNALTPHVNLLLDGHAYSYATTDIVSSPRNYLSKTRPTLLVSFARSGNSPESVAAVELADQICKENVYHLFITCNKEGALSKMGEKHERAFVIDLTPETNDAGFAMTSSYSNMMLAALLAFHKHDFDDAVASMQSVIDGVNKFFTEGQDVIDNLIDGFDFKRIVYLGSDSLKGTAEESQLKVLELTAGKVTTMFNSSMGFRHGPKSVVDDSTLTICYISDDEYTRQYDKDIVNEMCAHRQGNKVVAVMNHVDKDIAEEVDAYYAFDLNGTYDSIYLGFAFITLAQIVSLKKSIQVGIAPDTPNPAGLVNRVVKGVIIHPFAE